jgi:hypothetical protein
MRIEQPGRVDRIGPEFGDVAADEGAQVVDDGAQRAVVKSQKNRWGCTERHRGPKGVVAAQRTDVEWGEALDGEAFAVRCDQGPDLPCVRAQQGRGPSASENLVVGMRRYYQGPFVGRGEDQGSPP